MTALVSILCFLTIIGSENESLRCKVGTMFFIRPEALVDSLDSHKAKFSSDKPIIGLSEDMRKAYESYPAGGFCLFAYNLVNSTQTKNFTHSIHSLPGHPLVAVDEEGGKVARLANNPAFGLKKQPHPADIAASLKTENAHRAGRYVGHYLHSHGFDIDFAPVADVNTNPDNPVIGVRAFGSDPEIAGDMSAAWLEGLQSEHVVGCLKHFPGHGDTRTDSHVGQAESTKTVAELFSCEFIPFKAGIAAGAKMVMMAHIALPNVTGSDLPSTLSEQVVTGLLRKGMNYNGIIITDSMGMGAISKRYSSGEAAIAAILAGCDIILMPYCYREAFDAVVEAVISGRIPESRIDESVARIHNLLK